MENSVEWQTVASFLQQIGLQLEARTLPDGTFLPGLDLGPGCIYFDRDKIKYPGDILHEAGHLAVTPASQRRAVGSADLSLPWPTDGEEIGALLWSYAALKHLKLPAEYVFHREGYHGDADWLIENFENGVYIGLPFLEWAGLALNANRAAQEGKPAYPQMLQWLRD